MMCDKCGKNPATTHIKTVVNGVVKERNLCPSCAAKGGYGSFGKMSLANMLASMFGDSIQSGTSTKERCICCGSSFSDIAQSGRVGCSECYKTFRKELMPSLNRLHGKVQHVGKGLCENNSDKKEEDILINLKAELKAAVQKEEYERAAQLRDEIKKLEGKEENL